jgi:hypothetical protein
VKRICLGVGVLLAALALQGSAACATGSDQPQRAWTHEASARYMPAQDTGIAGGSLAVVESDAESSFSTYVAGKLPVTRALTALSAELTATAPFFKVKNTYIRCTVTPSFSGEDYAFDTSSFRIPSRYLLIYRPNSVFTYIAGLAYYPEYETEVFPIAGLIYQPSERWRFDLNPRRPSASYRATERCTLFADAGGSLSSEFEVTRGNEKRVILQYRELHAGTGVRLRLSSAVTASISGGYSFNRSLRYGDGIGKVTVDNSAYGEVRIKVTP